MYRMSLLKHPVLLLDFNGTSFYTTYFLRILMPNLMKIRLLGVELLVDGRTDRQDKANSRISQFFFRAYILFFKKIIF